MITSNEYRDWITRLHKIAEEFHHSDSRNRIWHRILRRVGLIPPKRPEDQCALRWSANIVAEKLRTPK
jgi:hypothetical protein